MYFNDEFYNSFPPKISGIQLNNVIFHTVAKKRISQFFKLVNRNVIVYFEKFLKLQSFFLSMEFLWINLSKNWGIFSFPRQFCGFRCIKQPIEAAYLYHLLNLQHHHLLLSFWLTVALIYSHWQKQGNQSCDGIIFIKSFLGVWVSHINERNFIKVNR